MKLFFFFLTQHFAWPVNELTNENKSGLNRVPCFHFDCTTDISEQQSIYSAAIITDIIIRDFHETVRNRYLL